MRRYISECLAGQTGPRGRDFTMRGIASLVAETYRIRPAAGFPVPRGQQGTGQAGGLRL